jgi:hypothetical protein
MKFDGAFWTEGKQIQAGTPIIVMLAKPSRMSVTIAPAVGGTATVEFTNAPLDQVEAGSATWLPLIASTDGSAQEGGRDRPTRALRITVTGAACVYEVVQ